MRMNVPIKEENNDEKEEEDKQMNERKNANENIETRLKAKCLRSKVH